MSEPFIPPDDRLDVIGRLQSRLDGSEGSLRETAEAAAEAEKTGLDKVEFEVKPDETKPPDLIKEGKDTKEGKELHEKDTKEFKDEGDKDTKDVKDEGEKDEKEFKDVKDEGEKESKDVKDEGEKDVKDEGEKESKDVKDEGEKDFKDVKDFKDEGDKDDKDDTVKESSEKDQKDFKDVGEKDAEKDDTKEFEFEGPFDDPVTRNPAGAVREPEAPTVDDAAWEQPRPDRPTM